MHDDSSWISIPRERVDRLPDADAHSDASWLPSSGKFSTFVCPGCSRVPIVPYQPTIIRGNEHTPAFNPHVYCNHVFCSACTSKGDASGAFQCPICQLEIESISMIDLQYWHKRLRDEWSNVIVRCWWSECNEKLPIDELLHHEQRCKHRLVKCHIPRCNTYVRPAELSEHIEQCPHAIRRCACGMAVNKHKKETHDCIKTLRKALTDAIAEIQTHYWKMPQSCYGFGEPGEICVDLTPYFFERELEEMDGRLRRAPRQTIPPETAHSVFTSSIFSSRTSRASTAETMNPEFTGSIAGSGDDAESDVVSDLGSDE